MVAKSISTIKVKSIDGRDSLFQISPPGDVDCLIASIKEVGTVNPIILQRKDSQRYRIVVGFRRYTAATALGIKELAAFIVDENATDLELFRLAMLDNLSIHHFNPIEVSTAIHKLQTVFHLEKEEVMRSYLPLLGHGSNPHVYDLYAPLCKLDESWQQLIIGDLVSVEIASLMSSVNDQDRGAFLILIKAMQLGKNRQREFWALLHDLCRISQRSLAEVVQDTDFSKILADQKLTPSQKADRFRTELLRRRYPRFMQTQAQFDALIKECKIPPDMQIRPSSFFSCEEFQINFEFKNEQEYQAKLQILNSLMENGVIKKMVELP